MIPIRDENPKKTFPFVTILIIAANIYIYIYQYWLHPELSQRFVLVYGAIPKNIVYLSSLETIVTSMFLHGGLLHLAGNMLYLWIFGDNIEDICGHFKYLLFYLVCGFVAFLSHFITSPFSEIPMIGASGAISGVLGAYLLKFPKARVHVLIPLFIWIWRIFRIPAVVVLGFWFLIQIWNGFMLIGTGGGVAWFAHIGGFVAGLLLIKIFERKRYKVSY
jgi:membrane associated rhomboid family serine protease